MGMICDAYADRLVVLNSIFYALPGALLLVAGESGVFRSPQTGVLLTASLVAAKFIAQYFWLFVLGKGDWPVILLYFGWWGIPFLAVIQFILWRKFGVLISGVDDEPRFKRDLRGAK